MKPEPIIHTVGLHKIYRTGSENVHAVNNINLEIYAGQLTAIIGRSGAGKTTFLNLISALDSPSEGLIYVEGREISGLSENDKVKLRRDKIGFIFQNFGLLPLLSARENVGIPLRMRRMNSREREDRITEALEWVGLAKRMQHRPYELSGGEQQRVSIARALAARPDILLADEPTGQLDSHTGKRILTTMRELTTQLNITLVVVTHDPIVMQAADILHELSDGKLIDSRQPSRV
jgi:putative ABC transport system ATP-binding protein